MITSQSSAAIALAQAGQSVFPCAPHSKTPLDGLTHRDATTSLVKVYAWWQAHPSANIGMRTGAGVFSVLDFDLTHPGATDAHTQLMDHGLLSGYSMRVSTPGGGMHYYFTQGTVAARSKMFHQSGVTYIGEGGWVIVPPSRIPGPDGVIGSYQVEFYGQTPNPRGLNFEAVQQVLQPNAGHTVSARNPRVAGIYTKLDAVPAGQLTPKYLSWAAAKLRDIGLTDLEHLVEIAQAKRLPPRTISEALTPPSHLPAAPHLLSGPDSFQPQLGI